MITRHVVKTCCGNKSFIFETQKPLKRTHLEEFQKAGYLAPQQFVKVGLFYVQKNGLIATSSFGTTKLQVRCNSKNCDELLNSFEKLLDSVTNATG